MTTEDSVSLCSLRRNQKTTIVEINAGPKTTKRLVDLGLTPKTHIEIIRKAIFQGPVEVRVRGSKLILGRELAAKILVKKPCP